MNCLLQVDNAPNLQPGIIYFGIRFQDLLFQNNKFYKALGFKIASECEVTINGKPANPTMFKLYSQADAARLGLIQEVGFSLIPENIDKMIPPYNDRYNTRCAILGRLPLDESSRILLNARFNFGSAREPVMYRVDPVSIKQRKSKRTTQTLYG